MEALEALGDLKRAASEHQTTGRLYIEGQQWFGELGLGPYPGLIHNLGYVALAAATRTTSRKGSRKPWPSSVALATGEGRPSAYA